jgi:multimeric flavodoxin WrbA
MDIKDIKSKINIITINGSPRKEGSTNFILDRILAGIQNSYKKVNITKYNLSELNINYCMGCKTCYKTGSCLIKDDMDEVVEDIIKSKLIIMGSPSYWGDVTGQMKVFFDRNTPYSNTNPNPNRREIPKGKKGIAVAIRAGKTEKENIHIFETIEHYYGHLGIEPISRFSITNVDKLEDLFKREHEIKRAFEFGKSIGKDL